MLDLPGDPAGIRVAVAMSGGVDSSVVAALVARAGYDTIGLTLQLYDSGAARGRPGACCAGADIHDARRAAEAIGIPHYVLDYEDRFRKAVIDRFADSYLKGETPIPCVECNRSIKFTDLLEQARQLGADVLATGHYIESRDVGGRRALFRAVDSSRDQSYFLYATTQDQLQHLRFPLGTLPKSETRQIARDLGLAVAEKPDSQDICFVPGGRYTDVIAKIRPDAMRAGDVVDLQGRVLGRHSGIGGFTVGQRRGIGVAAGEPLYVVALDPVRGRVVVGPRAALATTRIVLRELNWLGEMGPDEWPADGLACAVRVRSTRPPRAARLFRQDGLIAVDLVTPEDGVSPGQACVIYTDDGSSARLLGGGTIMRRIASDNPVPDAA